MQGWVLIYAIGAAQAALLALVLWRRPANAGANRILAAWLALVAFDLAVRAGWLADPSPALFKPLRLVTLFPFLHASLFFLYVRALTTGRGFRRRDLVHLAGFGVALVAISPMFLLDPAATAAQQHRLLARELPAPFPGFNLALFGYAFAYIAAAMARILRHHRQLRRHRADADRQSLHWLVALAFCQLAIWAIATLHLVADLPFVDVRLIYGAVAAWILVVGWFSLAQPPVVALPEHEGEASVRPASAGTGQAEDDARFPEVEARLSQLMVEESLYTAPALTIGQLARRSGYPEYLVSAVINRRFGGNFWEYVNRHRIEATRACLSDPADTRTILEIAYACGFTSKSTFNAAFKRLLGETPSAYRRRHAAPAPSASAG